MPSPTQAWVALRTALIATEPACKGDSRFTADDSDPEPLIRICRGCPLLNPCRDLANMDQPIPLFGVVGGRVRRGNRSTALMNAQAASRLIGA